MALTTKKLRAYIFELAALIEAPKSVLPLVGEFARDGGSPDDRPYTDTYDYIEVNDSGYHYVIYERTKESSRTTSTNVDDVMYEAFVTVTSKMTSIHMQTLKAKGSDPTVTHATYKLLLMNKLNDNWAKRLQKDINKRRKNLPNIELPKT